jgi:succinate dehydrogenase/fumarate reductase flavoprotein subunit
MKQASKIGFFRRLISTAALTVSVSTLGCSMISGQNPTGQSSAAQSDYLDRGKTPPSEGKYQAASQENQKALAQGQGSADAALFNLGLLSATSQNPKKDYPKALQSFKALVAQHPRSSFAEQSKLWIQVLEEHQRITEERQKLMEEKRTLIRERELLAQERERLNYTAEKSRQLDLDIEKRRRKSLNR